MKRHFILVFSLFFGAFLFTSMLNAEPLAWSNSIDQARGSAKCQGKLVLLLAGRPTCENCEYMKNVACEAPVNRTIIDEAFVPWYVDIDKSSEWLPYASGLGGFTLPLICMIDPMTTNTWLLRRTSYSTASVFERDLRSAMRLALPRPVNLGNNEVIHTTEYAVTGRIWSTAEPVSVFYRIWSGTTTVPFGNAVGTTNWAAQLSPHLTVGVSNQYHFEVYAEYANGTRSPTNGLAFVYDPSQSQGFPRLAWLTISCGVATMRLEHLTPGSMTRVERTLDLRETNGWNSLTNFIPTTSVQQISDMLPSGCERAFYRIAR